MRAGARCVMCAEKGERVTETKPRYYKMPKAIAVITTGTLLQNSKVCRSEPYTGCGSNSHGYH